MSCKEIAILMKASDIERTKKLKERVRSALGKPWRVPPLTAARHESTVRKGWKAHFACVIFTSGVSLSNAKPCRGEYSYESQYLPFKLLF
jgi:uroporphyrinogen-III synthase